MIQEMARGQFQDLAFDLACEWESSHWKVPIVVKQHVSSSPSAQLNTATKQWLLLKRSLVRYRQFLNRTLSPSPSQQPQNP